ncbi:Uncharacterised protein [Halioglobus japonicus]|nr:Uncharacterised protein [Halioglobus japonicus]
MIRASIFLSTAMILVASQAHAVPVSAISELAMNHSFVINSGNSPEGIDIINLSSTLVLDSNATSAVDDPGFTNSSTSDFQVGNPFSEPPLPVLLSQADTTINLGNADFATANVNYSITSDDDPAANEFDLTRRAVEQAGRAQAFIANSPADASASSSSLNARSFRFDNTTNNTIAFNIAGLFEAEMLASYDGDDGFARTSGGFEFLFDVGAGAGASVDYFPIAPYLTTIEDDDPGASVMEQFLSNSGGISGVSFIGSATAIGDGSTTTAQLFAQSRYLFTVTLDGGASLLMETGFRQNNAVGYTPQNAVIPLPASLPLVLTGLLCVAFGRRKVQQVQI